MYRSQTEQRIGFAQHAIRMLYCALQRESVEANNHFHALLLCGASSITTSDSTVGPLQWSQSLHIGEKHDNIDVSYLSSSSSTQKKKTNCSSSSNENDTNSSSSSGTTTTDADAMMWTCMAKCIKFSLGCIATNISVLGSPPSSSSSTAAALSGGYASVSEIARGASDAVASLFKLREILLLPSQPPISQKGSSTAVAAQSLPYMLQLKQQGGIITPPSKEAVPATATDADTANTKTSAATTTTAAVYPPLSPYWIRCISAFMRTVATFTPMLLQSYLTSSAATGSSSSNTPAVGDMDKNKLCSISDCEEHIAALLMNDLNMISCRSSGGSSSNNNTVCSLQPYAVLVAQTLLQLLGKDEYYIKLRYYHKSHSLLSIATIILCIYLLL